MKTVKIELTAKEAAAVSLLLAAELFKYNDRRDHALSHGGEFQSDFGDSVGTVLEKVDATFGKF